MKTVRLTMAQALVRYLVAQKVVTENGTEPLFGGIWADNCMFPSFMVKGISSGGIILPKGASMLKVCLFASREGSVI